jgi:inorganic pyrophosphatase
MAHNDGFWGHIERLVAESRVVVDHPRGSPDPSSPGLVYPADYGYLEGTRSMDGGGVDVWVGSVADGWVDAIICTVDLAKRDSEIKVLMGCSEEEKQVILKLHNSFPPMRGLLIRRRR